MRFVVRFQRGLEKHLPENAALGEPLFTTDTCVLYIGMGADVPVKKIGIIDPKDLELVKEYYQSKGYMIMGWMGDNTNGKG